jgi:hypothetical protein
MGTAAHSASRRHPCRTSGHAKSVGPISRFGSARGGRSCGNGPAQRSALAHDFDLIAVGAPKRRWFGRFLMESVNTPAVLLKRAYEPPTTDDGQRVFGGASLAALGAGGCVLGDWP